MYCTNCGKQIEDEAKFCQYCGCRIASYGEEAGCGEEASRGEEAGWESTVPSDVGMRDTVVSDVTGQDTVPSESGLGGIAGGPSGGRSWSGAERVGTQDVQRVGANGLPETEEKPWLLFVLGGIAVAAVVAIAVVSYLLLSGSGVKAQAAEQLKLGNRYLEEMDYEQAVVAFTKTIEIDPSNVDAYLGASMAYAALENYQEAVNILESGYETTEAPQITERGQEVCLEAAEYYITEENYEEAEKYIEKGKEYGESKELDKVSEKLQEVSAVEEEEEPFVEYTWSACSGLESGDMIYYLNDSKATYGLEKPVNLTYRQEMEGVYDYAVVRRGNSYGLVDMDGNFLDGVNLSSVELVASHYRITYAEPRMDSYGQESATFNLYGKNDLDVVGPGDYSGVGFYFWNQGLKQITDGIYGEMPEPDVPIPVSEGQGDDTHMDMDPDGFLMKQYRDFQGKYAIYADGGLATGFLYDECGSYSEGLFAVSQNGKWGYVDKNGEVVIPVEYDASWKECIPFESYGDGEGAAKDYCYAASGGYVVLRQGDAWELRDVQGRLAVPQGDFEELLPVYGDRCWAKKDGQWGVLELKPAEEPAIAEDLPSRINYYRTDGTLLYYETFVYYDNGFLCSKSLQNGETGYNIYTALFLYDAGGNLLETLPSVGLGGSSFFEGNRNEPGAYEDMSLALSGGMEGNAEKTRYFPAKESIGQEKFGVDPARTESLYDNLLVIPTGIDDGWAALYYGSLFTGEEDPNVFEADCWFMDVDADEKPELFIDYGYTYLQAKICTAGSGAVDQVVFDAEAHVEYIPKENLILIGSGRMDAYSDVIYKIENGKYSVVGDGRIKRNIEEEERTGSADLIYDYTWDQVPLTEAEYDQKVAECFDKSRAVDTRRNRYSYRQCKRLLEHLSKTGQGSAEQTGDLVSWEESGLEDQGLDFKDAGLEAAMRRITGISDRDIMLSDVWEYTELNLYEEGADETVPLIRDISALGVLKNLKTLEIRRSEIEDISAIGNLAGLTKLHLYSTKLEDVSALRNLTGLTYLHLYGGGLSDVSALGNLTGLTTLHLYSDHIEDISALQNLTQLQELSLNSSRISDISALGNLTALTSLTICESGVSDIRVLGNLRGLKYLDLSFDKIRDIQALSNLTNLTELDLSGNDIADFSPLDKLANTKITY